jgi:hypothetical protein
MTNYFKLWLSRKTRKWRKILWELCSLPLCSIITLWIVTSFSLALRDSTIWLVVQGDNMSCYAYAFFERDKEHILKADKILNLSHTELQTALQKSKCKECLNET